MNTETRLFQRNNDAFDSALIAACGDYISYSEADQSIGTICLEGAYDQEKDLMKKDLVEKLSKDAYYITTMIMQECPDLFTPKINHITKSSVQRFLRKNHWHPNRITKAFIEVQGFVKSMKEIE